MRKEGEESRNDAPVHRRRVGHDPHQMSRQSSVERPSSLLGDDELERLDETGVLGFEHAVRDGLTETGSEDLEDAWEGNGRQFVSSFRLFSSSTLVPKTKIWADSLTS